MLLRADNISKTFFRKTGSANYFYAVSPLSLEIHPFEVKPEEDRSELLGMLGCEAHQAVLVYDADSGLHIAPTQFRPWAELLERRLFRGPYLLCPRSIRNRMAIPESDLFAKMVSDLRNE